MKARADQVTSFDEAVLYAAIGLALAVTLFASGAGSGSYSVGVAGAALVGAGTLVSWRMRQRRRQGFLLGAPLGLMAAAGFLLLVVRELAVEESRLYAVQGEVGLMLALRMASIPLALSFLLLQYDVMAFSLVPCLATFGLVGSQGNTWLAGSCFALFLPAALVALGHGMLLSGALAGRSFPGRIGFTLPDARRGARQRAGWRLGAWRVRHWSALGITIALIGLMSYALFYPIAVYFAQYRWPLLLRVTAAPGLLPRVRMDLQPITTYPVGRGRMPLSTTPFLSIAVTQQPGWIEEASSAAPRTNKGEALAARAGQSQQGTRSALLRPQRNPTHAWQQSPGLYWRGAVFDFYTGQAWLRSQEPTTARLQAPGTAPRISDRIIDLTPTFPPQPGAPLQSHVVRAEVDLPQPFTFYSPGQILMLAGPSWSRPDDSFSRLALRVDDYGCVESPWATMRRGFTYQVISTPLEMQATSRATAQGGPARERPAVGLELTDSRSEQAPASQVSRLLPPAVELPATYLRIPFGARRVAELARQIAADEPTPERKLAALISYLQQHCVYSLDAPATPRGHDAADYFLFQARRGYCDLFATSLAVMGRAVGIPTRMVTGYAFPVPAAQEREPGAPRPARAPSLSGPPGAQTYLLRECDAHSWVEAYLLPWGWVTADATPAGGDSPIPPFRRSLLALRFAWQDYPLMMMILVVMVLAAFGLLGLSLRASRARLPGMERPGDEARYRVVRAYAQLLLLLRRRGRPRRPSQTPLEFLAALRRGAGLEPAFSAAGQAPLPRGRGLWPRSKANIPEAVLEPVAALTELFVTARYGPGPVGVEAAQLAQQHLASARARLRRGESRPAGQAA